MEGVVSRILAYVSIAGLVLAAGMALTATPAAAGTGFSITYSFGHGSSFGHRSSHDRDWRSRRGGDNRGHQFERYRPAPRIYWPAPPSRVVVLPPRTIYVPSSPVLQAVPASPVFRGTDGRYCREYQTTVTIAGTGQPGYGTACLEPDGTWRVVN